MTETQADSVLAAILALRDRWRSQAATIQQDRDDECRKGTPEYDFGSIASEAVEACANDLDALLPDLRAHVEGLQQDLDLARRLDDENTEVLEAQTKARLKAEADLRAALAPPDEELALATTRSADLSRELRECVFALAGPAPGAAETLTPERINTLFKCVQAAADYLDAWPKLAARAAALAVAPPLEQDE